MDVSEWWECALLYIHSRSDYNLSREMNWITREISIWKSFQILNKATSEIADKIMSAENDPMR